MDNFVTSNEIPSADVHIALNICASLSVDLLVDQEELLPHCVWMISL